MFENINNSWPGRMLRMVRRRTSKAQFVAECFMFAHGNGCLINMQGNACQNMSIDRFPFSP